MTAWIEVWGLQLFSRFLLHLTKAVQCLPAWRRALRVRINKDWLRAEGQKAGGREGPSEVAWYFCTCLLSPACCSCSLLSELLLLTRKTGRNCARVEPTEPGGESPSSVGTFLGGRSSGVIYRPEPTYNIKQIKLDQGFKASLN